MVAFVKPFVNEEMNTLFKGVTNSYVEDFDEIRPDTKEEMEALFAEADARAEAEGLLLSDEVKEYIDHFPDTFVGAQEAVVREVNQFFQSKNIDMTFFNATAEFDGLDRDCNIIPDLDLACDVFHQACVVSRIKDYADYVVLGVTLQVRNNDKTPRFVQRGRQLSYGIAVSHYDFMTYLREAGYFGTCAHHNVPEQRAANLMCVDYSLHYEGTQRLDELYGYCTQVGVEDIEELGRIIDRGGILPVLENNGFPGNKDKKDWVLLEFLGVVFLFLLLLKLWKRFEFSKNTKLEEQKPLLTRTKYVYGITKV